MKHPQALSTLRIFISAVALISLLPAGYALVSAGYVPPRYLWIALPLYTVIILAASIVMLRAKHHRRSVAFVSAAVLILATVINIGVYMAMRQTTSFMSGIQQASVSYVEYSVIAKKHSGTSLDSAATCGVVETDQRYSDVIQALASKTDATPSNYKNLTSVFESLVTNQDIQIAALRSASLSIVKENNPDFYQDIEVIGTFTVREQQSTTPTADVAKPFAIYVSGIDTYGDIGSASRSDVNILAAVNPDRRSILLVNTPRDYYVQLHGTTGIRDKLTHAGVYGIDMSRQTIQDLYGVEVPYYIRLNFSSLIKIVDTIGPISVYSDYDFKSYKKGYNTLNSTQALEFSRERYSFEAGDRERGRNQQRVIEAIIAKLSEPSNIVHYNSLLGTLQGSVQTNISEASLITLANKQLDDMKRWQVTSIDVDGTGATSPTYSMGSMPLYVMIPNQQTVDTAKQQIADTLKP
jgi:LCP family protein required for cell wall assembly